MPDLENTPYTKWLEEAVGGILDFKPDSMCLIATRKSDGMALTAYYNSGPRNMGEFIHHIESDRVMDIIQNNAHTIRRMLEPDEEEPEDDFGEREEDEPPDYDLEMGFDPYLGTYTNDC